MFSVERAEIKAWTYGSSRRIRKDFFSSDPSGFPDYDGGEKQGTSTSVAQGCVWVEYKGTTLAQGYLGRLKFRKYIPGPIIARSLLLPFI